ncbi:hypothetical protein DQQ10_08865 [Pseudochryseolinea flava]|uniref:DUF481 domain-containing protein n=1 Tax=Pseudochryseolinea flava TaxID=2059302 RepID=A0A364Y508_9BACT|nr:hypothetical protein DQQ10_08865 [Pseudochryseolinea flava]
MNYTATGIVNKTNDGRSYVLNNNLRFSISKKRISANSSALWIYGKQNESRTNNDIIAALDFNIYERRQPARFYTWGLASYESSFSLKINARVQTGLGIGYNIVDRPNVVFIVSDGILYEHSDLYQTPEGIDNDYETARNSFRIKFRWVIKNRVTIDGSDFLQHALNDRKDYIVKSNTNVSVKLLRWLSFTTSLVYNKISLTNRENLLLNYGLTIEKYF